MNAIKDIDINKLEELRKKLNEEVEESNLLSGKVIKLSQELDIEIVKEIKDKLSKKNTKQENL